MKVFATSGSDDLARVYMAQLSGGRHVEFVESKILNKPREKKWVLIISTMSGCPIGCPMCDAGALEYRGRLSAQEMLSQIDFLTDKYYPSRIIPVEKFKIQFARVGEPSLNPAVLQVLKEIPARYYANGLTAAVSTIAPAGREDFFENLKQIKNRFYRGKFQLQFSVHSTMEELRFILIPYPHWKMEDIARFGEKFVEEGDKKITLNFAVMDGAPIDADVIARHFDPLRFLIKLTPLNPTRRSVENNLSNGLNIERPEIFEPAILLKNKGYDVILSIGELEENRIGSNCGQFIRTHLERGGPVQNAYTYVPSGE
jgi:23S rRNA (adenine2503-C2)-methyltransferase